MTKDIASLRRYELYLQGAYFANIIRYDYQKRDRYRHKMERDSEIMALIMQKTTLVNHFIFYNSMNCQINFTDLVTDFLQRLWQQSPITQKDRILDTKHAVLMAPQVGLEPTTFRLTAERSAIELLRNMKCGSDLLSRAVTSQVPSTCQGLTSVFGMGTGGTPRPLPPQWVNFFFRLPSKPDNCI